jgi:imidazole glycerol-phosphate synthase subunit HisF
MVRRVGLWGVGPARLRSCHWFAEVGRSVTRDGKFGLTAIAVVANGVDNLQHLVEGVTQGHASVVLAASIFHFGQHSIADAHAALRAAGLAARS